MLVGNVLLCYVSGENLTHDSSLSLISLFYVSLKPIHLPYIPFCLKLDFIS